MLAPVHHQVAVVLTAVLLWTVQGVKNGKQPNIIYILADDLGYNDLGYMNSSVLTPNLDTLSETGAKLDNNYVYPTCTPSRVALMTGRYAHKQGFQHIVLLEENPHCVNQSIPMLPEKLKDLGYSTHMLGKWHMGFCKWQCTPTHRGFDTFYGFYSGMGDYYSHSINGGFDWRDNENVDKSTIGQYSSDLIRDRAIRIIEEQALGSVDKPFFMYLAFPNPHRPFQASQKYLDMYPNEGNIKRKSYLAMVTAMDEAIGDIVATLKSSGLYKDTFIAFSSDNGGQIGVPSNYPLRGGKASLWEGGVRAQAFIHGNGVEKVGKNRKGLFHITDWAPSILKIAGEKLKDPTLDGIDQSEFLLSGKKSTRNEFVINIDLESGPLCGVAAIRVGDWKLISGNEGFVDGYYPNVQFFWQYYEHLLSEQHGELPEKGAFGFSPEDTGKMLSLINFKEKSSHLYYIKTDPNEMNDLSTHNITVLRGMQEHLANYVEEYVAPPLNAHKRLPEANPDHFGGNWTPGWC